MRVIAEITEPKVIAQILEHIASREAGETLWWLGRALERAERIGDAKRVYESLPAKCKGHFRADDALNRLGTLFLEEGDSEKGLGFLTRLGRAYPESRFRRWTS